MASHAATQTNARTETELEPWQAGLVGGLIGGITFGIVMTMQMRMVIEMAIPGMYGFGPSLALGWGIHVFHSVVLGVVFGLLLRGAGLDSDVTVVVAGLAYGVVLWVVLASFVMPAWVGAMTEMAPPVPDWNAQSLMGHAVFGVVLGVLYAVLTR